MLKNNYDIREPEVVILIEGTLMKEVSAATVFMKARKASTRDESGVVTPKTFGSGNRAGKQKQILMAKEDSLPLVVWPRNEVY